MVKALQGRHESLMETPSFKTDAVQIMSAASDSGMTPAAVYVKQECDGMLPAQVVVKMEQEFDGMLPTEVKEERGWDSASEAGFYAELELKHEVELGPEQLQPQDIAYVVQKSFDRSDPVNVKQELAAVDNAKAEVSVEPPRSSNTFSEQFALGPFFIAFVCTSVDNDNPHKCLICHKVFPRKSSLTFHMRTHDKKIILISEIGSENYKKKKLFSCDTCGKCFSAMGGLTKHIPIHSKEPYPCDICKKKCKGKYQLNRHKLSHIVKEPHTCDVCKKQFQYQSQLNTHKLIHRKGPYKCDVCKKQFKHKCHFDSHSRTGHNSPAQFSPA